MAVARWFYTYTSVDLANYEDGDDFDLFISNYFLPGKEHLPEMFDVNNASKGLYRRFWQYLAYLGEQGTEIVSVVPITGTDGATKKLLFVFKERIGETPT